MANLNYNHLRYFWEVAREGNLTRAAERLAVSQSALSTQIRRLEERLGHPLFERLGRQLVLTEAGRIAMRHANAIFATGEDLLETLRAGAGRRRHLRVGALATLSRNFQIEFLRPCLGRSDLEIILTSGSLSELEGMLRQLELDIVLCNTPPSGADAKGLVVHRLAEQPISLFGAPCYAVHPGSARDVLECHPVVLPTGANGIRAEFDALCRRLKVRPTIVAEVDDMAMLRLMAREALGVAPLPAIVVRDELQAGTLLQLFPLPSISETFFALTVARQFPNSLVEELILAASNRAD